MVDIILISADFALSAVEEEIIDNGDWTILSFKISGPPPY